MYELLAAITRALSQPDLFPAVSGEISPGTAAWCNLHDQKCPCHSVAGGDFVTMARSLSWNFKSCAQDNRMRIETGQKWKAKVGKPVIVWWLR